MTYSVLVLLSVILALSRFIVPVEGKINTKDIYKDVAHVFVGFLFGYAFANPFTWYIWALPIGLTVVEVVAFFVRRK